MSKKLTALVIMLCAAALAFAGLACAEEEFTMVLGNDKAGYVTTSSVWINYMPGDMMFSDTNIQDEKTGLVQYYNVEYNGLLMTMFGHGSEIFSEDITDPWEKAERLGNAYAGAMAEDYDELGAELLDEGEYADGTVVQIFSMFEMNGGAEEKTTLVFVMIPKDGSGHIASFTNFPLEQEALSSAVTMAAQMMQTFTTDNPEL